MERRAAATFHLDALGPSWTELDRDADMRRLRRMVEHRRTLVDDRVAITDRITSALKGYWPEILGWFRDKDTPVFAAFPERWPTLDAAKRARQDTLITFFRAHNVRSQSTIARRLDAIQSEEPLATRTSSVVAADVAGATRPFDGATPGVHTALVGGDAR